MTILYWMQERFKIYVNRANGLPKPWTNDPILRKYRFCNVYRELDKVTVWIRQNWRDPHAFDPDTWFAMTVARLINWPDSLAEIGYPVPWDAKRFIDALDSRRDRKQKVFTGAYMIHADSSGQGHAYKTKARYLAMEVLEPLWKNRRNCPKKGSHLHSLHSWLMRHRDLGSFMAGQVVADAKFTSHWTAAPDWWTFAVPGPGSSRGLNRVLERDTRATWKSGQWEKEFNFLYPDIAKAVKRLGMPPLSAQDFQNCLCEFDKYERVRLGEGRPRSMFDGG